jgi:branched-chain amino acid transport system substrate-binding protein
MKKMLPVVSMMLLVCVVIFTFFGESASSSSSEVNILKIGASLPLNVAFGMDTKKALEVIVPMFNEAGGISVNGKRYKVDLIIYDDKYTADGGRAAVERLVYQDKVQFLVCQIGSVSILPGMAITESEKILSFVGGASDKLMAPENNYMFRAQATVLTSIPIWVLTQKLFPNAKTAVLLSPDHEGGKAKAAIEGKLARSLGFEVDTIFYPPKTTDFSPFATKINTISPAVVNFAGGGAGSELGLQLKALYTGGYRGGLFMGQSINLPEVLTVCPPEAAEGVVSGMSVADLEEPPPVSKEFKDAFIEKYGSWNTNACGWTSPWYACIGAIKKADSLDPTRIANLLHNNGLEWEANSGNYRLVKRPDLGNSKYCDALMEWMAGQVTNGKVIFKGGVSIEDSIVGWEQVHPGEWR